MAIETEPGNGVMDVDRARANVVRAQSEIDGLRAQHGELAATLDEIGDEVRHGKSGRAHQVEGLSAESSRVKQDIERAERDLDAAKARFAQAVQADRRRRFDAAVAKAREERAEFVHLYRAADLALGAHCVAAEEAGQLASTLMGPLGSAEIWNILNELKMGLDPVWTWDDATEHLGYGFDLWKRLPAPRPMKLKIPEGERL